MMQHVYTEALRDQPHDSEGVATGDAHDSVLTQPRSDMQSVD